MIIITCEKRESHVYPGVAEVKTSVIASILEFWSLPLTHTTGQFYFSLSLLSQEEGGKGAVEAQKQFFDRDARQRFTSTQKKMKQLKFLPSGNGSADYLPAHIDL